MIGLAELLVVAAIVLVILFSRRQGGPPSREPDVWTVQARFRVPRSLVTVGGAVASALVTAVTAVWLELPATVGTVAAGVVAGIAATILANRGSPTR